MAVLVGAIAGLIGAAAAARAIRHLLYGIGPFDGVAFIAAAIVFAITATAVAIVPARHAIRIDPVRALRRG